MQSLIKPQIINLKTDILNVRVLRTMHICKYLHVMVQSIIPYTITYTYNITCFRWIKSYPAGILHSVRYFLSKPQFVLFVSLICWVVTETQPSFISYLIFTIQSIFVCLKGTTYFFPWHPLNYFPPSLSDPNNEIRVSFVCFLSLKI